MKDEIKEILDSWKLGIEKGIDKNGIYVGGLCYSWEQLSFLLDYITNLQQENDNYKAQKYITDFITENGIICEKNKQIDQLTNNWNELEEWLKDLFEKGYDIKLVLNKMNEIKGGNNV